MTEVAEGIHDISDARYLGDPCPGPSLNNTVAKTLVDLSPAHAFHAHPRLGGTLDRSASEDMEFGTAVHAAFLRGPDAIAWIDHPSYQSIEAKRLRAEAHAANCVPLKVKHRDRVLGTVAALEDLRQRTGAFSNGRAEQTLVWREGDEWCRAKVDWLPDDPAAPLWDLKVTGSSATEKSWTRIAFDKGYEQQEAFYCRGAETLRGEPPPGMMFAVVESTPPHGLQVFRMTPAAREIGDGKVSVAIGLWAECMSCGFWPSYPLTAQWVEPPPWVSSAWAYRTVTGRALAPKEQTFPIVHEGFTRTLIEAGHLGG